jgi:ribosomal protein S12 methylthiotransferase accessory factor YcaO
MSIREASDHLLERPNDTMMAYHLIKLIEEQGKAGVEEAVKLFNETPHSGLFGAFVSLPGIPLIKEAVCRLGNDRIAELFRTHPLRDIRSIMALGPEGYQLYRRWNNNFNQNRDQHVEFGDIDFLAMPFPIEYLLEEGRRKYVGVDSMARPSSLKGQSLALGTSLRTIPVEETYSRVEPVMEAVMGNTPTMVIHTMGGFVSMAVWQQNLVTRLGRHHHSISGNFSSSGKGFSPETALASCLMEMTERVSAAAGIGENWPEGYCVDPEIRFGRASELREQGLNPLEMSGFNTLLPYRDEAIYWTRGEQVTSSGRQMVYVPAQGVFEFSVFDEPEIMFTSSNGLASGNIMEEAKLHALLEIIERDGDNSMFYTARNCFSVRLDGSLATPIMAVYAARGFNLEFLDLTTELGVPTYRAFLKFDNKTVLSGSGAHLDGRIAALRAIGELHTKLFSTDKSLRASRGGLPPSNPRVSTRVLGFEELPNFSTGNVQADLSIVENLLLANGFTISYVDLTRKNFGIPVVRAIVPGLDYPDSLTRRQLRHFMQLMGNKLELHKLEPC